MKNRFYRIGNGISIGFFILFMFGCSSHKEKPIAKSYTVEIRAMRFQPSELLVRQGDTVVFVNKDMLVHNVTEEKTKEWSSESLATGDSYKTVVNKSSDYYCSLHPVMKGKLLVE